MRGRTRDPPFWNVAMLYDSSGLIRVDVPLVAQEKC